jgi:hypothetical protein
MRERLEQYIKLLESLCAETWMNCLVVFVCVMDGIIAEMVGMAIGKNGLLLKYNMEHSERCWMTG